MALVEYSDSSCSESGSDEDVKIPERKRLRLNTPRLPLPTAISCLQGPKLEERNDNPEEHDGRVRSFEHERGNWATYVYIPVNLNIIDEIQALFIASFKSDVLLKESNDLHISLTKTVVLRHHWIDSFVSSIREKLPFDSEFLIGFTKVSVYCNEERTRTFIGLTVGAAYSAKLERIMCSLNDILEDFKLEKFYDEPSFHTSILWCVGDHKNTIKEHLPKLQQILTDLYKRDSQELEMKVREICCKTGNKLYVFDLRKK